jgi:hypothetical protein
MEEELLQYIWEHQLFNQHSLKTAGGEDVQILQPGKLNRHQGPDFFGALIRLGDTVWCGQVELHGRSSDWHRHRHTGDPQYSNVILHVVWEDDGLVYDDNQVLLPALELKGRVPIQLIHRYREMMDRNQPIVCHSFLPALPPPDWSRWKEKLLLLRLERKTPRLKEWLSLNGDDWNTVFWWLFFEHTGGKVNGDYFLSLARSIPLSSLLKKQLSAIEWEALLLGQANLLPVSATDAYLRKLTKEYEYLRYKYQLKPLSRTPAFLRMRPASFPTLRIAQLSTLLYNHPLFFNGLLSSFSLHQWREQCMVTAGDYWDTHYRAGKLSRTVRKAIGQQKVDTLAINVLLPVFHTYAQSRGDESLKRKVLAIYYQLPPEHNRITQLWNNTGIKNSCSVDSQALTELTHTFCQSKNCLHCAVGQHIFQPSINPS